MRILRSVVLLLLALVTGAWGASVPSDVANDVPNVAAASDLQFALEEIAATFNRDTGKSVRITFGSSGNFRRQIAQGAPFELFLSADETYVQALANEGLT